MRDRSIKIPNYGNNFTISRIKKVLIDLKKAKDIEGSILVDGKDFILASALPKWNNYEDEVPKILAEFRELGSYVVDKHNHTIFNQQIFEYNGFTILTQKLMSLTLFVMIQNSGYVGLAMLDIENSIREIDHILQCTKMKTSSSSVLNLTTALLVPNPVIMKSSITGYGEKG